MLAACLGGADKARSVNQGLCPVYALVAPLPRIADGKPEPMIATAAPPG
jgi:hypothetical protein